MRSHRSYLLTAFFIALLLSQAQQSAQAQNVYIIVSSSITYDSANNKVNGVSQTSMDYRTNLYYRARAKGYIYTQNLNSPLAVSDNQGASGQSVVTAQSQANASAYTTYNLKTEHYLLPLYCEAGCSYYLDYYNYYYSSPYAYYGAPSEFGSTQTIYGCNPYPYQTCYPNTASGWIWMGNTNTSTLTPPSLSITNSRVSGNLKGTTQNVLLASPAGLQATVTPAGLGGNFVWSFTGPFTQDSSSQDNSFRSIFWTQPGTYAATVTYSGSGFSVSGTVNTQVRVPTLTSFSGTASNTVVNRGSNCGDQFDHQPFGTTVSMGCSLLQDGMVYSATATIPNVAYLSNPAETGITFKQIVSAYRKHNNRGRFECRTARNPQSNPTTGWQKDAIAGEFYSPGLTFSNATTITHEESDLPGSGVSGRHNDGGAPFEYEAFLADDLFETYVYYFAGANSAFPSFSIPLHVADAGCPADRFDCGVDLLAWRFGPQVHFDSSIQNSQYRLVADNSTVGTIPVTRRSSVRSHSGLQQTNQYSLCQGAQDITNPIDGSRFFTQQLYLDVLHRNPDEIGWNNWTTTIASCGFDGACIYNMRIHTARGFLESSENFANSPLLTSPDSHIRNREYVRLCYVSFLGRPPDQTGWNNWTEYLDSNPGGYNHVVGGFIYSWEYRGRFGNP